MAHFWSCTVPAHGGFPLWEPDLPSCVPKPRPLCLPLKGKEEERKEKRKIARKEDRGRKAEKEGKKEVKFWRLFVYRHLTCYLLKLSGNWKKFTVISAVPLCSPTEVMWVERQVFGRMHALHPYTMTPHGNRTQGWKGSLSHRCEPLTVQVKGMRLKATQFRSQGHSIQTSALLAVLGLFCCTSCSFCFS